MPTPYEILRVAQNASHLEIKRAYHCMMLRYHPDKNPNISEKERIIHEAIAREANRAWEILRDSQQRKEYDQAEHHPAKREKRNDEKSEN